MIEKQAGALVAFLKNNTIKEYAGEAFWEVIKAVISGDVGTLIDVAPNVKNIVFHAPTVLFWDKMERYLLGTFRDFEDQVKMAAKFSQDNSEYERFVKKQMNLINELNDDKKS